MTKEEKIKEIYSEYYERLSPYIDINGWVETDKHSQFIKNHFYLSKNIETIEKYDTKYWRPKSLSGIENNNGWIKIESESDLPKEDGFYWIVNALGKIKHGQFLNNKETLLYRTWLDQFTYYQPTQKPEPPIY